MTPVLSFRSLLRVLTAAALTAGSVACASIVGVKDGVAEQDAATDGTVEATTDGSATDGTMAAGDASPDGARDALGDAPPDATADGAQPDTGEPPGDGAADADVGTTNDAAPQDASDGGCTRAVDAAAGVFVVAGSEAGRTCGTMSAPCATVQDGVDRASTARRADGLHRRGHLRGVRQPRGRRDAPGRLAGERHRVDADLASPSADQAVVLVAPAGAARTLTAIDLGGAAGIETLSIQSKPQASVLPGESIVGIFATGSAITPNTALTLDDVVVSVVGGGKGNAGLQPAPGGAATGTCPAGTGAAGTLGPVGAGSAGGAFSTLGYAVGNGSTASPGGTGSNGTVGADGGCVGCMTASCTGLANCLGTTTTSCGAQGFSGCGGPGGAAGPGGGGGGSSAALFVWNAQVTATDVSLTAGAGGAGGAGGPGGLGGIGSPGQAAPNSGACNTALSTSLLCATGCMTTTPQMIAGGAAGGAGGTGEPAARGAAARAAGRAVTTSGVPTARSRSAGRP